MTGIHSRVLKEFEEVLTKVLSIIYLQSWLVLVGWKSANMTPCTRVRRMIQGTTGLSDEVLGKVMEQIIVSAIMQHIQDNQGTRPSQPGFRKCRSCSTEGQEDSTEGSGQVGSMCPGQLCEVPQCQVLGPATGWGQGSWKVTRQKRGAVWLTMAENEPDVPRWARANGT